MSVARRVLRIFARGNVDVKDSLLWSRVGGELQWNGINEVLRTRHPGLLAKVRHETCARLDLLPLPGETLPAPSPEFTRSLPSGAHPLDKQHRSGLFEAPVDAVVLSLQSATTNALVRHRREGWLLLPDAYDGWDQTARALLESECENAGMASLEETMSRLEELATAIAEQLGCPLLVYNLSPAVPGERTHCWLGAEDSLSLRVRRFNVALSELSARVGFSIVDVERIAASAGTDRVKVDLLHLNAEGWRLVAEEVVRILEEQGCLDGFGEGK
jgi:hypothetical protein